MGVSRALKHHDDLVAVLQVGTRRASFPAMDLMPVVGGDSPEERGLLLSGAMDLMSRAGAVSLLGIQREDRCPAEVSKVALRSAEPLADAIGAGMTGPVLEWAGKARALGRVAPPSVLIRLLPLVQKHRAELLPVVGTRGKWLASLQGLVLEDAAADDLLERRTADALAYCEWLAADFDRMDWKDRAKAIAVMSSGLSLTDEPLLERALSDRRKEVREPACDLLTFLPGSRVSVELIHLAQDSLSLEKSLLRKHLVVEPPNPESLPKWLPKTPTRDNFGPKALALFDLVRYVPPSKWETGVSPEQFLTLAAKSDYARAIVDGLQESAVRFNDQTWIDVVFEFLSGRGVRTQERWADLAHLVSEPVFDRIVSQKLSGHGSDTATAVWTISFRRRPLSLALSRELTTALRTSASHHYVLRELAVFLHPETMSLFDAPSGDPEHFEDTMDIVRKILDVRRRLLASLED